MKLIFLLDRILVAVLSCVLIALLLAVLFLIAWATISRRFGVGGIAGWDELVELFVAWLFPLGVILLWRERNLFTVTTLLDAMGPRLRKAFGVLIDLSAIAFGLVMLIWGAELAIDTNELTPVLGWPKIYWYVPVPIAGLGMVIYSIADIVASALGHERRIAAESLM